MTDWKPTACVLCECNCGLEVELGGEGGRHLVKLRGDKRHPASRGYACEKAHRLDHYQNARDRLLSPLRRRADGTFEEIDWDTAIREVAERLAKVRDTHGGDTIFYYGGGGQGNHLPGAYATATRRVLGSRYRSSALAQEKTGEFWVNDRMMGASTRGDFEHCDVALFIGKNPWHSHSIPRARVTLKEISADPARTLIVIDPRRTETAAIADVHLAVRPGQDAFLLAAILAVLVEEELLDRAFLAERAVGLEPVVAALRKVPIDAYAARAGIDVHEVRRVARIIGRARAFSCFEDLGVQMNHRSTLVSYLHKLLVFLTGSFGKPGSQYVPTTLIPFASGASGKTSPVAGAPIISGLVPCNVIAEEILTDHPKRYRAMIVEAANPVHSLADSQKTRAAMRTLDTVVVIDVAMTETAALADYVLPASTQYEKAEATFFNFDFPENQFQLRPRLLPAPPGPLPEAEIHARLVEAMGALVEADLAPLRDAAKDGRMAYAQAMMMHVMGNPRLAPLAPIILYRTLPLADDVREGAVLFGLALKYAMEHGPSLARAGFAGSPLEAADALFTAMLERPYGVVFAVDGWDDVKARLGTADGKIHLFLPDLLEALVALADEPVPVADAEYPYVLSAGERRSFTANTIIRDPSWRKKDVDGALRIHPDDAAALGVATGDAVTLTTRRGSTVVVAEVSDSMQRGHVSLPNGLGLGYPGETGHAVTGVAPNELTSAEDRDPFVGTPWHKHVRARLERVGANPLSSSLDPFEPFSGGPRVAAAGRGEERRPIDELGERLASETHYRVLGVEPGATLEQIRHRDPDVERVPERNGRGPRRTYLVHRRREADRSDHPLPLSATAPEPSRPARKAGGDGTLPFFPALTGVPAFATSTPAGAGAAAAGSTRSRFRREGEPSRVPGAGPTPATAPSAAVVGVVAVHHVVATLRPRRLGRRAHGRRVDRLDRGVLPCRCSCVFLHRGGRRTARDVDLALREIDLDPSVHRRVRLVAVHLDLIGAFVEKKGKLWTVLSFEAARRSVVAQTRGRGCHAVAIRATVARRDRFPCPPRSLPPPTSHRSIWRSRTLPSSEPTSSSPR